MARKHIGSTRIWILTSTTTAVLTATAGRTFTPNTLFDCDICALAGGGASSCALSARSAENREFRIDLETGHILRIQESKKKQVVYDFIDHVGLDWMDGVEAVACDMNSDFQEAFEEKYPHIQPVFDHFHIIKNFNDKVISQIRKDEQGRLLDSHFDGIIAHASLPISSGKMEGINNKIKTIRRQAYGLPDDTYFFLKLIDASKREYVRNPVSHKIFH